MNQPSARRLPARSRALQTLLGRRPGPATAGALAGRRFRPRLEVLETRTVPTVLVVGPNVNITKAAGNQAESTISVDPNNPARLFECDTLSDVGHYSVNGGLTWNVSDMSALPASFGDVQTAWDRFGNLFLTQFGSGAGGLDIVVARSSDGGATFKDVRTVVAVSSDQPSIAVGPSGVAGIPEAVWISVNSTGNAIFAAGAPVLGFDSVGAFGAPVMLPSSSPGDFGSIAVGPSGQVMANYQNNGSGAGPDTIHANLDPDGLGASAFGARFNITGTNVGGFSPIPPQPSRTIDAESSLAWDVSGGPHNGRVYVAYVDRPTTASADTDIFVRFSDDNGATWSPRVRVNDDALGNGKSQLQPAIAVDQSTGNVAVTWYDARNSGAADNTTQVFGTVSENGGATWLPNVQISAGTSNASAVDPGFDYGDYDQMGFSHGVFYRTWADNSNSTGDNPNGTAGLDIYTASVSLKQVSQTALAVSATITTYGQPVTFTATVTGSFGTPTGFVTFQDFGVPLATIPLSGGVASFTTTGLGVGSHQITAVYSGDNTYLGSTSPSRNVGVAAAATQTSFRTSASVVAAGQPITLTSTVGIIAPGAGVPTGTITFFDGVTPLATRPVHGANQPVSVTVTLQGVGTHTLYAVYSGDANFSGSTSPSQKVLVGPGSGSFAPLAALPVTAPGGSGQADAAPNAAPAAPAPVPPAAPAAPADLAPRTANGPAADLLSGGTGAPVDPAASELAPPGVDHRRNPEW